MPLFRHDDDDEVDDDLLEGHGGDPDADPAADDPDHEHDVTLREAVGVAALYLLTHRDRRADA